MSQIALSYPLWLADFYLLSTVLLALALTGSALLAQPAQRLAIAKSALIELPLLAALCAVPGWSFVHLLTAEAPKPVVVAAREVSQAPAVSIERARPIDARRPNVAKTPQAAAQVHDALPPPKPSRQIHWQTILPVVHLIGAVCIATWLGLGWFASLRLRRTAKPAPPKVVSILNEVVAAHFGRRDRLRLLTHQRIDVAVALGMWRPTVFLPTQWCERESPEHLRTVLAHEATHVFNRDLQWVAVARLLLIALWANPLYWITRRRLRLDQEALADAAAAELTSRQQYAEQLVVLARRVGNRSTIRLSSAVGLWEGPSQLRRRIALLLNERLRVLRDCSRRWRFASFAIGATLAVGLSLVTLRLAEPPAAAAEKPSATGRNAERTNVVPPAATNSLRVRVTNDANQPIKGAKVLPYGMRSGNDGGHFGWFGEMPGVGAAEETSTDNDGLATVQYPRFVGEKRPVDVVSLQVSHPDYVSTTKDVSVKDSPSSVRMERGGVVEIRVDSREKPALDELFGLGGPWGSIGWTRTKDGTLRSPHLGVGSDEEWTRPVGPVGPAGTAVATAAGQHVRVVWLPKNRPAQFSLVANVQLREGETKSLRLELQPGTRLTGKLDGAVPRPIVGGKVVALVDSPGYTDWYDWAPIKEDGTFEFTSLPRDQNVQIMAFGDGFISAPGSQNGGSQFTPQLVALGRDTVNHVIKITRTATAVVKLRDPRGQPVSGAKVSFCPNIFWTIGSNIVGTNLCRSSESCLDPDYLAKTRKQQPEFPFTADTDDKGVARITNLPPFPDSMQVDHERFQLPESKVFGGARRLFNDFKLQPGKTTEVEVTLQPKEGAAAGEGKLKAATVPPTEKDGAQPTAAKTEDTSGDEQENNGFRADYITVRNSLPGTPNTLDGQCVDENGKPLKDVEIIVSRVWYQDAARREWIAAQATHADGKFRFDKVVDTAKIYPGGKIPKLPDFSGPYFQVAVRKPGRVSVAEVIAQNDVARQGSRHMFKMPPGVTLRGHIINPKGQPVGGALVSVGFSQLDRWENFQTVRSYPDGRYEINDVPPFDSKNVQKTQTWDVSGKQDELIFPRVINVEHPNYASEAVYCKKIPGTQDVQLKAAAVITGRVIDGTTRQPVASAAVLAFPSRTGNPLLPMTTSYAFLKTDGRGEYRITSLPEGAYDLWAVAPNLVNEGVKKLKTSAERETNAPDLVMTGGGTIRVRLIDDKTRKPVTLLGDERAEISVNQSGPIKMPAQVSWRPQVEAKDGRFEVRALPGDDQIDSLSASSDDAMKWIIRPGEPVPARVVEGKSTDVDVRVQDVANMERWNRIGALFSRAVDERSTDEHKSIADFEQIIKLDPPYPHNVGAYACLARILATSADDSVRDGKRAIELAQKAQQLEDKPSAFVLEALAAAYAEVGDFDGAVASEKEAIELAKKEDKREPPTEYLKLYEAHKPRRDTKPPSNRPSNKASGANQPERARVSANGQPAPTELAGRVEGPDGKPLAGVTVDAWTWYAGNETKTDDQGRFRLKGFSPNQEVEIEFRNQEYGPRHFIDQRAGTPDWVVKMDNTTYLEGAVVSSSGAAVPHAEIRAERGPYQRSGMVIGEVTTIAATDSNGRYRLYLEPDTYRIKVRVPGAGVARYEAESIAPGEKKPFHIRLQEGITFRAKVVDTMTDKPVEGLVLWNWQNKEIEGTSNAEGVLEIPSMFPGKFEFNVTAVGENRRRSDVAGKYGRWWSQEAVKPYERKLIPNGLPPNPYMFQRNFDDLTFDIAKDSPPATIYAEPLVTITGRVIDPDGKPVAGATVAPAKTGSGNSLTGDTRFSRVTKKDGAFELKLPASGLAQYNLIAHDGGYEKWRKWANGVGQPFTTLPGDHVDKVELRLTRPAMIRGQVLSDSGQPVAGKQVRAADFQKRDNRYYVPTTKTDKNGNFELKFVSPGKNYVQVEPFYLDADQAPEGTSAIVEVKEGATVDGVLIAPALVRSETEAKAKGGDNKDANPETPAADKPKSSDGGGKSQTTQPKSENEPSATLRRDTPEAGVPMLCVDRNGKPVSDAEVYLFQFSGRKDGRYQQFGPFTSDAEGRSFCKQADFYDNGGFDRWIYVRVPGQLVGTARSVNWKQRSSIINPQGRVVLVPSHSVEGRVTVPAGFDPQEVTVKVRTMNVITGEKQFDFKSFSREDSFVGLNTALPKIFERHPGADGRIRFDDIPVEGRLYLVTIGKGLGEAQWWNGSRTFEKPIQLRVEKEARLLGRVLLPDGKPAAGMGVAARISSDHAAYLSTFSSTTNVNGEFVMNGLPSVELCVSVGDPKAHWAFRPVEHIQIAPGESQKLTLTLEQGTLVSGRIVDENGKPVEGASFDAIADSGSRPVVANDMTKADGQYRFRVPAGGADLYFDSLPDGFAYPEPQIVKHLDIKRGQEPIENLDFTLPRERNP